MLPLGKMMKSFNGNPLLDLTSDERGPLTKHFENRSDSYLLKICCYILLLHARITEFRRQNFPFFIAKSHCAGKDSDEKQKAFFFFFCPNNMWKDRKKKADFCLCQAERNEVMSNRGSCGYPSSQIGSNCFLEKEEHFLSENIAR